MFRYSVSVQRYGRYGTNVSAEIISEGNNPRCVIVAYICCTYGRIFVSEIKKKRQGDNRRRERGTSQEGVQKLDRFGTILVLGTDEIYHSVYLYHKYYLQHSRNGLAKLSVSLLVLGHGIYNTLYGEQDRLVNNLHFDIRIHTTNINIYIQCISAAVSEP